MVLPLKWNSRIRYMLEDVVELTGKRTAMMEDDNSDKIKIKDEEHLFEELNLLLAKFIKNEKIDECLLAKNLMLILRCYNKVFWKLH